jgi:hypothetical protein
MCLRSSRESGLRHECAVFVADIESLGLFSGIHPLHFEFHRMLASRFPFGIYYREHGDEAQVYAVLDLRRNPNWIRKELKKRDD